MARPWKKNAGGAPKRVGVNGFGFGGSNAHVILEEYVPTYHQPRYGKARKPDMPTERVLSVVGIGSLFPFIPGTRKEGKPPLYFDQADHIQTGKNSAYNLRGAEGALDIADAVQSIKNGKSVELVWPSSSGIHDRILRVSAPGMDRQNIQEKTASFRQTAGEKIDPSNPIYFCTLRLTPIEGEQPREHRQMQRGRLLILADQTSWQGNPGDRAVFDDLDPTVLCPAGHAVTNAVPVDLSSEEAIAESLRDVDFTKYDGIIAVKDLSNAPALDAILADGGSGGGLLDLMFSVVRQAYERLKTGETAFGSLCLNAIKGEQVHPYSGLLVGFTKAIARELPLAPCKAVAVDTGDLRLALHEMETEWGMGPLPAPAEVIYKNSVRHEYISDHRGVQLFRK